MASVSTDLVASYVTGTWYLFEMTIIDTSHVSVRWSTDNLTWSASTGSKATSVTGNVDAVRGNEGGTAANQTIFMDYISPTNPISSIVNNLTTLGVGA